jgi:uncharacterized protein (DUF433 family)
MNQPCVVRRSDGPKIQGTRITVYTVLEYLRGGRSRDWIAASLGLSSRQVQAAMDYIRDNEVSVSGDFNRILERIREGNPPQVESQLRTNREKVRARLAQLPAATH